MVMKVAPATLAGRPGTESWDSRRMRPAASRKMTEVVEREMLLPSVKLWWCSVTNSAEMGLPATDFAPRGPATPIMDDEIEMGGGAICTVMGGTLSSEAGAAAVDAAGPGTA